MKISQLVEMYKEAREAAKRNEGEAAEYFQGVADKLAGIIARRV